MKRAIAAGLAALTACAKPAAVVDDPRVLPLVRNPAVIQAEESNDYEIRGQTIADLAREISRLGPKTSTAKYAGSHSSRFRYSYTAQVRAGRCVPQARVSLYSITTLPHWVDSATAEPEAQAAWTNYITALHIHEDNHRRIALKYASQLRNRLAAMSANSCAELQVEAERLAQASSDNGQKEQEDYDERTRHGLTEGATFRPATAPRRSPRDTISPHTP